MDKHNLKDNWNAFPLRAKFRSVTLGDSAPPPSEGFQKLKSGGGKCLDVSGANVNNNGAIVHIWNCQDVVQQKWKYESGTIKNEGGKCLDVDLDDYNNNSDGAKVQIWDCNTWDNQQWTFSGEQIKSKNGKCLDVDLPGLNNNGGKVQLWTCAGSGWSEPNQKWSWN
eukprot:311456_1